MSTSIRRCVMALLSVVTGLLVAACGGSTPAQSTNASSRQIAAVGAENEYANVISQVGGPYVAVSAIESNPNTDPHTFEASPSVANQVSSARLIVQNGLGYDDFMSKIESASPNAGRDVITVQRLLALPDSTPNPHLWYRPDAMPAVADAVARDLSALAPQHAGYFRANAERFDRSLGAWDRDLRQLHAHYPGAAVATTEPVGDYLLEAAGTTDLTPFILQADVMNGVDPAPQDISRQQGLLAQHRVKALLYNEQVTDSLTQGFLRAAAQDGVPVVAVYETMPSGYDYQSWMLAEVRALRKAIADHASTPRL